VQKLKMEEEEARSTAGEEAAAETEGDWKKEGHGQ